MADCPKSDESYFMTKAHTDAIRGVLLTIVIIFHESALIDVDILPREGSYAVFVFFFLSGYGLCLSRRKKGYLSTFAQKKILGLLFRYWIIAIVLAVMGAFLWSDHSGLFDKIMDSFITPPHWYILQLLCFYLVFWLVSLATEDTKLRLIILAVLVIAVMNLQYYQFDSALYRRSGTGFVLGMLLAEYRGAFDRMEVRIKWIVILASATILLFNEAIGGLHATYGTPILFCTLIVFLSGLEWRYSCPVFIILGLAVYPLNGATLSSALLIVGLCSTGLFRPVLGHLGRYSLEMYLIHYTLLVYFFMKPGITDATLLFLCTFASTLAVSVIVKTVSDMILKRYDELIDRSLKI